MTGGIEQTSVLLDLVTPVVSTAPVIRRATVAGITWVVTETGPPARHLITFPAGSFGTIDPVQQPNMVLHMEIELRGAMFTSPDPVPISAVVSADGGGFVDVTYQFSNQATSTYFRFTPMILYPTPPVT